MKAKTDQEACDLLDNLVIASPCSVPWDSMQGDERKRLCCGCSKNVFNISDMSRKEAESFLLENGTTQCMIFKRRFDGTIITDDCPVGLRKIRNACRTAYRAVASFAVLLLAIPGAMAQGTSGAKANVKNGNRRVSAGNSLSEDMSKPTQAPPGYEYSSNPAGGGMILRPVNSVPKNEPTLLAPGRAIAPSNLAPSPQPVKGGDSCAAPDVLVKKKPHVTTGPQIMLGAPAVLPQHQSTAPESHPNLDSTAHVFYDKGVSARNSGNTQMANFYFEKALESFDKQKAGDPRFRKELLKAIESTK